MHRETLIPQATRVLELALASYSRGKQNFLIFLDAENTVLDSQLRLLEVEAKAARAKWKLYRALGVASLTQGLGEGKQVKNKP